MIACLLLFLKEFTTADDALRWFGYCRTSNGKGVTIPSQARYVHYFERLLFGNPSLSPAGADLLQSLGRHTAWLHAIHVHTVPHFDPDGGSDLYFEVKQRTEPKHRSARDYGIVPHHKRGLKNPEIWFELSPPMQLTGDVKLVFYDKDMASSEKVCCCWLNVGLEPGKQMLCPCTFVPSPTVPHICVVLIACILAADLVVISKDEMDGAVKDKHFKHFDADFRAEILLSDSQDEVTMKRADTGRGFIQTATHG